MLSHAIEFCGAIEVSVRHFTLNSIRNIILFAANSYWTPIDFLHLRTMHEVIELFFCRQVKFGSADCNHLVITCSAQRLNVWNLLTLKLLWTVPVCAKFLTADPRSEFMAIFTTKNDRKHRPPELTLFSLALRQIWQRRTKYVVHELTNMGCHTV